MVMPHKIQGPGRSLRCGLTSSASVLSSEHSLASDDEAARRCTSSSATRKPATAASSDPAGTAEAALDAILAASAANSGLVSRSSQMPMAALMLDEERVSPRGLNPM